MRIGAPAALCVTLVAWMAPAALAQTAGSTAPSPAANSDQAANATPERYALHGQSTVVVQGNTPFRAPYQGPNSFDGTGEVRETFDATLFAGVRLWPGLELWLNPEIDQGFGLRNTLGAAGFPSAEAYKVGKKNPYLRLQRLFFRQTIDLGGEATAVAPDLNVLGARRTANRLTITIGKFSVGDIFDQNQYAHDPRGDFLNWTAVDAGTFDYAADAWGYTYGGAAELTLGRWTARGGLFDLSTVPNSVTLETGFRQYQVVGEVERRVTIAGRDGAIRVTGWLSHGNFALLSDAIAFAAAHGGVPDPAPVRHFRNRQGIAFDVEQAVGAAVGVFLRAGVGDGTTEVDEFTDADRTVSGGVAVAGSAWGRKADKAGFALIANTVSAERERYLALGGLGILVGDGRLPHPGAEVIGEGFYSLGVTTGVTLTGDAQLIIDPAYNRDRGPVPVLALRLHVQR